MSMRKENIINKYKGPPKNHETGVSKDTTKGGTKVEMYLLQWNSLPHEPVIASRGKRARAVNLNAAATPNVIGNHRVLYEMAQRPNPSIKGPSAHARDKFSPVKGMASNAIDEMKPAHPKRRVRSANPVAAQIIAAKRAENRVFGGMLVSEPCNLKSVYE